MTTVTDWVGIVSCSPDLFKLPSTTSSDAASSTPRTSVSAASSFWEMVPIDWPGADVTQLTFSNENHIHIVVQPELTGTSRIHILPVISLALDAMSGVPINIKPQVSCCFSEDLRWRDMQKLI